VHRDVPSWVTSLWRRYYLTLAIQQRVLGGIDLSLGNPPSDAQGVGTPCPAQSTVVEAGQERSRNIQHAANKLFLHDSSHSARILVALRRSVIGRWLTTKFELVKNALVRVAPIPLFFFLFNLTKSRANNNPYYFKGTLSIQSECMTALEERSYPPARYLPRMGRSKCVIHVDVS
jgi:hypothetical protein